MSFAPTPTQVLAAWSPTPSTRAIRVAKPPGFTFAATQTTLLILDTPDGPERRPFSPASSPAYDHIEYATRLGRSSFKQAFAALRPGDTIRIAGPRGRFLHDVTRPAVMIAGGIGITPFKAMIEHAADEEDARPITLLYSSRSADDILYRDELAALQRRHADLRIRHTLTRAPGHAEDGFRRGRIDRSLVARALEDTPGAVVYVAGTPGFAAFIQETLDACGVDEGRVVAERFMGYGRSTATSEVTAPKET